MKKQSIIGLSALSTILFFAPGCKDETTQPAQSIEQRQDQMGGPALPASTTASSVPTSATAQEVLMSIDGKPVLVEADLHLYKNDIIEAQPEQNREQYRQLIDVIPGALKNIFDSAVNEEIIAYDIAKKGIDKSAAYLKEEQENLERFKKINRRTLNIKKFQESINVTVSPAEVRKYYDENKNKISDLMASAGGVSSKAVFFETEVAAKAFYDKIKDKVADFEKTAEEQKITLKDLGQVHENSYEVDAPLRTKVTTLNKFPSIEFIKIGDSSWAVVKATAKEEPKYVPFEQVQAGIENWLKQQKATEILMKELEKLKKEYKVEVNEAYFARQAKASPAAEGVEGATPQKPSMPQRTTPVKGA